MNRHILYALCLTIAGTLGTSTLTSCSSDIETASTEESLASGEITVAPYPSYAAETRAVDGAPTDKDAWETGDRIFIQVNGGEWTYIKYTDDGWYTDNISISKGDSYKAVYAPNYDVVEGKLVLGTDEKGNTNIGSTGEYLEYEGTGKPIIISFVRKYSRLRVHTTTNDDDKYDDFTVTLGNGFKTNDGTEVSSFTFTPDEQGNAYIYGTWEDNTHLDIESQVSGDPGTDALYVVTQASQQINGASTNGKAYATAFIPGHAEVWVVNNLDHTTSPISDWSGYTSYANLKVIGTWDSDKAPVLKNISKNSFTHVSLSNISGLTSVPNKFFFDNYVIKQVDLPETITEIGEEAFRNCDNMSTLNLPSQITTFNYGALYGCKALTIEELPKSTTSLDGSAFASCKIAFKSMPNVTIVGKAIFYYSTFTGDASFEWPSNATDYNGAHKIPESTFANSNIASVTIPENITDIDDHAFSYCTSLTTIICKGSYAPTITDYSFYKTSSDKITIYVPKGTASSYDMAGWSKVGTIVEQ